MRYGVLGGTFDPPHLGHLALARAAQQNLELDDVMWVPAYKNPTKDRIGQTSPPRRLRMVELCVADEPGMSCSDIEIARSGPSYSVETVEELTIARPGDYWLILGADAVASLPRWHRWEHLMRLCRFAAAVRPPHLLELSLQGFPEELVERIDAFPLDPVDVSSSVIRDRVFYQQPVARYLKPVVLNFIEECRLYIHD